MEEDEEDDEPEDEELVQDKEEDADEDADDEEDDELLETDEENMVVDSDTASDLLNRLIPYQKPAIMPMY